VRRHHTPTDDARSSCQDPHLESRRLARSDWPRSMWGFGRPTRACPSPISTRRFAVALMTCRQRADDDYDVYRVYDHLRIPDSARSTHPVARLAFACACSDLPDGRSFAFSAPVRSAPTPSPNQLHLEHPSRTSIWNNPSEHSTQRH
jgi:hypothetical protein